MYPKDFCNSYHKIDHNRLPNEMCLLTSYPSLLWSGAWQTSCSLSEAVWTSPCSYAGCSVLSDRLLHICIWHVCSLAYFKMLNELGEE